MLSERIMARNFKGIRETDLDLRSIDCAVVVGHNGAGKSSLIVDARLWALFGESLWVKDLDKHIKNGTELGEVIYEWETSGKHYRVTRKRSVKSARGSSSLRLEESRNGVWEDRTGEGIGETQDKILKAFPIDMKTLCSSSIIGQGEVEAFCEAGPTERAIILSKILNQERYKDLEKMARKRASNAKSELNAIENRILENDVQIRAVEEAQVNLKEAKEELKRIDGKIKEQEKIRIQAEKDLVKAQEATKEYEGWKSECGKIELEIEKLKVEIVEDRPLIERYQKILENKDTVRAKVAEEKELKEKTTELNLLWAAEKSSMESIGERLLAEGRINELKGRISEHESLIARKEAIEKMIKEGEGLEAQLQKLKERRVLRDELIEKQQRTAMSLKDIEHEQASLKERFEQMEEQVRILDGIKCHPEEDPGYVNESCLFLKGAVKARKKIASVENDYKAIGMKYLDLDASMKSIEKELGEYDGIDEIIEETENKCNESRNAKGDIIKLEVALKEVKEIKKELETDGKCRAEFETRRAKVDEIRGQVELARETLDELHRFTKLDLEIDKAEAHLPVLENKYAKDLKRKGELTERETLIEGKIKDADGLFAEQVDIEKVINEADVNLLGLKELQAGKNQVIGNSEAVISQGKELVRKNKELNDSVGELKEAGIEWEILEEGFKQLPFLVYEKAVPEIEKVSNEILREISPFGLQVTVDTQKTAKTTKNISDEVSLGFVDDDGEKDYAMLSGGERVRAALAIRIAIGELAAKRAGEKVEELIIDEGWGPLDTEGIEAVKDCMRRLRDRFQKMFVISHIDKVKDLFGTRIVMDKRATEQVKVVSDFV